MTVEERVATVLWRTDLEAGQELLMGLGLAAALAEGRTLRATGGCRWIGAAPRDTVRLARLHGKIRVAEL